MNSLSPRPSTRLPAFVEDLQSSGRYSFSLAEAQEAVCRADAALSDSIRRLKRQSRLVSPRRGFFVIVPVEYRSAGSPPVAWFLDDLMAHLGQPYYVGLLTAAAFHGAAHQQPQVFQVVTDRPTRPVQLARLRIDFHRNRSLHKVPVERLKTDTGSFALATAEAAAFDLVRYPDACGHLDQVATVLAELAESLDPARIAEAAASASQPDAQRLGFLLEKLGFREVVEPLRLLLSTRRRRSVLLAPKLPRGNKAPYPFWAVVPNHEIDPDL